MRRAALVLAAGCGRVAFAPADSAASIDDDTVVSNDGTVAPPTPDISFKLDETFGQLADDSAGSWDGWVSNVGVSTVWQPPGPRPSGSLYFTADPYSYVMFPSTDGACPVIPSFPSSLTVSTWVSFEQFGTWDGSTLSDFAVAQGTSGGTDGGWAIGATDGCGAHVAAATVTNPAGERVVRCGATALSSGVWYHIAGVYNANALTLEVYLNGTLDSAAFTATSPAVPGSQQTPTFACGTLGMPANGYNLLRGSLDDVRIYRRALSADEIASIHAANGT